MKATHIGDCQVCGSTQKLPSGHLSKHGYTVEWNCFNGTCRGSGHLPFEQSIDLIEAAIVAAQSDAKMLEVAIADVLASTDIANFWIQDYGIQYKYETKAHYFWRRSTPRDAELTTEFHALTYLSANLKRDGHIVRSCGSWQDSNKRYADHLQKSVDQLKRYVRWQQARIAGWTPRELRPVHVEAPREFQGPSLAG
jgi:hypothetical protein